jgi:hypothetical protein
MLWCIRGGVMREHNLIQPSLTLCYVAYAGSILNDMFTLKLNEITEYDVH